jgi:Spy/CpxP family protein refolding chaperone
MRQALLFSIVLSLAGMCLPAVAGENEASAEKKDPVLIYREAGANEEQEAKIRQFAQEYEKEAKVRIERLHNLSKQMRELSFDPELDEAKVLKLQDEINELQNTLNKDRIKLMLKIRGVLSPEQKTKLVELLKSKEQAPQQTKAPADTAGKTSL